MRKTSCCACLTARELRGQYSQGSSYFDGLLQPYVRTANAPTFPRRKQIAINLPWQIPELTRSEQFKKWKRHGAQTGALSQQTQREVRKKVHMLQRRQRRNAVRFKNAVIAELLSASQQIRQPFVGRRANLDKATGLKASRQQSRDAKRITYMFHYLIHVNEIKIECRQVLQRNHRNSAPAAESNSIAINVEAVNTAAERERHAAPLAP